jgi:hypothetical protein
MKKNLELRAVCLSENLELRTENLGLVQGNVRLVTENERPEALQFYMSRDSLTCAGVKGQQESVLMHYNELHSRSAEVEAVAMNFELRVADAVIKAGLTPSLS